MQEAAQYKMSNKLDHYIELLSSFVNDKIAATEFENKFLKLFKEDKTEWPETEYSILDEFFGDVDAFCSESQLRDENDLSENELKEKCKIALEELQSLVYVHS